MKKALCLFIVVIVLSVCSMPVFSVVEREDSLTFETQVFEILDGAKQGNTIKIYNGHFIQYFAEDVPIHEIIQDENLLKPYYVVKNGLQTAEYFYIEDNQANRITINPPSLDKTLEYVTSPDKVLKALSEKASIQNIYYLNSESSYSGIYIYYVTDKGDYIYYQDAANDDAGYLFALTDFCNVAKEAYAIIKGENTGNLYELPTGGPTLLSDLVDISEYQVTPGRSMGLYIGLVAIAVVMTGAGIVFVIWKKRKRTT